jgi:hypothetical protein
MRYLLALAIAVVVSPVLAEESGIRVTGLGQASVIPNCAHITVGVVSTLPKASESLQANGKSMDKVFAALKGAGINENDIKTVDFRIDPQYEYNALQPGGRKFLGYRTNNTISIKTEKIKDLGDLLDVVVSNGANEVYGISFEGNSSKANDDALKDAMNDAKERALLIAKAGGFELGPIVSVTETIDTGRNTMYRSEGVAPGRSKTPIAAGTNTVSATVSVLFSIKK